VLIYSDHREEHGRQADGDSNYRTEKRKIDSQNKVFIDQLDLRQGGIPQAAGHPRADQGIPAAEMKKLILANTVVGEQQLRSLAEARAAGVRSFLVE
jgi:hypothetical protein